VLFVFIAALLMQSVGCRRSFGNKSESSRVCVDFWVMWTGFEFKAMEEIVDKFNASQNEVEVRALSVSSIRRKLLLAIAGNDAPDLAILTDEILPQFADKNALLALDEYLPLIKADRGDYIPVFWDICMYDGRLYGLPASTVSLALHWNKQMFSDAGLDPEKPPRTLEELDELAEKLTHKDEAGNYTSVGFLPTQPGWWPFCWVWWFGGSWVDDSGAPTANTPENIRAFEWVRSYSQKFGTRSLQNFTSNLGSFSSAQNGFFSEKNAMVLQGVWLSNFISKYAPDLQWGAAPFPAADGCGNSNGITLVQCDALVIPRNARHKNAAARFIGFMQQPENLNALAVAHGKFSPLSVVNADIGDHPNKEIEVFIGLSKSSQARVIPRTPVWAEYSSEISLAFESVWLGSKSAEDALNLVQKRMDKNWSDYLRVREAIRRKGAH
jgi:ABC-type glycerol-3-phosphate transport system substrate-binding protein